MSTEVSLSNVEQAILDVLRREDTFFTRSDIARAAGIKTSTFRQPFYTDALQRLVDLRLITVESRKVGLVKTIFVYRAI